MLQEVHLELGLESIRKRWEYRKIRLSLSHLCEHKFRHNFQDTLNPICSCGDDIETAIHYLLHCPNYLDETRTILDNLQSIGENIHGLRTASIWRFFK